MADLRDAFDDHNDTSPKSEPAPLPEPPKSEPTPEPAQEPPKSEPAQEPAPEPAPRKLPAGVLDAKPPPQGEKAKSSKGSKGSKNGGVSHENRERFAETFGPLIDDGLNVVATAFGSPVRADNADERDPSNGLVLTVKFGSKSATLDTRREGVREATEKVRNGLGNLFARETPGRAVAYHMAGVAPGLANLETWLQEHPWTTLTLVSLATIGQFSMKVVRTAPQPPVVVENKADGR